MDDFYLQEQVRLMKIYKKTKKKRIKYKLESRLFKLAYNSIDAIPLKTK